MKKLSYRSWEEHSEVLYHAFSIEEVIRADEEIPTQRTEPRQLMGLVHNVANRDDLVETFDLNREDLEEEAVSMKYKSMQKRHCQ